MYTVRMTNVALLSHDGDHDVAQVKLIIVV